MGLDCWPTLNVSIGVEVAGFDGSMGDRLGEFEVGEVIDMDGQDGGVLVVEKLVYESVEFDEMDFLGCRRRRRRRRIDRYSFTLVHRIQRYIPQTFGRLRISYLSCVNMRPGRRCCCVVI